MKPYALPLPPTRRARRSSSPAEVLEARIVPAVTVTLSGTVASFLGSAGAESLSITESGGLLRHDHGTDPGFADEFDFDSTLAGVQSLAATSAAVINFDSGAGNDSFTSVRSTSHQAGSLNVSGPVALTSTLVDGKITVNAAIAAAGSITLVADNLDLQSTVNAGDHAVNLKPYAYLPIKLGQTGDAAGRLSLSNAELGLLTGERVVIGGPFGSSNGIEIVGSITRHAGFSSLNLATDRAITQTASLSVANLKIQSLTGGINLDHADNDVDRIAGGAFGGGSLSFTDIDDLAIDSVLGIDYLQANNLLILQVGAGLAINRPLVSFNLTISITAGGGVTESASGSVSAPNLVLAGTGSFVLTSATNDVSTLAANTTGAITYVDANALTIGSVSSVTGLVSANAAISVSTVDGNLAVENHRAGADVDAGTATVSLTAGSAAGQDRLLSLATDAGVTGTSGVTLQGDHLTLAASVNAGTRTAILSPATAGTLIELGGSDAANTLGLSVAEINLVAAGILRIGASTAGDLTVRSNIAPAGTNQLELVTGARIVDGFAGAAGDLTVARLALFAETGIGITTPEGALEIAVLNLEAQTTTGGIALTAGGGNLTIGDVTPAAAGVRVATSGAISVTTLAGSIFLADFNGFESVRGGSESGDVVLTALGANSDIQGIVDRDSINAPGGSITLTAGRDILLGTLGSAYDNDVRASGSITFNAGRDFTIAGFADVLANDFNKNTGGGVTINVGRNLSVSTASGDDATVGVTGSGNVAFTAGVAGAGGQINVDVDFSRAVFANGGDITFTSDAINIASVSEIYSSGSVTFRPYTSTTAIYVGVADAAGILGLSTAELAAVRTGILRLGDLTAEGGLEIKSALVGTGFWNTLSLVNKGLITQTDAITVANLAARSASGVVLTSPQNKVGTFAGSAPGAGSLLFDNSQSLIIDDVDGLTATAANATAIFNVFGTLAINHPISAPNGTITLHAAGTTTQATDAPITAEKLRLTNIGSYTLQNPLNDVDVIAASGTGSIRFTDADDLEVGTVIATVGITTSNDEVALVALGGQLQVVQPINVGNAPLSLTAGSPDSSQGITSMAAGVLTGTGGITFVADHLRLGADVNAGTSTVAISPSTSTTATILGGADASGVLGLTNAELNLITAGTVQIGTSTSGPISITEIIAPRAYQTLAFAQGVSFAANGGFIGDLTSSTVYERIVANGAVEIAVGASLALVPAAGFTPALSDTFIILENTSTGEATTGAFGNLAEGSLVFLNGVPKALTYAGGIGGNDLVLSADAISVTASAPAIEGGRTTTFTFSRNGTGQALTISFDLGGTAVAADYTLAGQASFDADTRRGTITFAADSTTATLTLSALGADGVEGTESLTATVIAGSDYVPAPGAGPIATSSIGEIDLSLTTVADRPVVPRGETVVYTLSYANVGQIASSAASIDQVIPAGTTFNAALSSAGWTLISPTLARFTLTDLPAGGAGTLTFALDVSLTKTDGLRVIESSASISAAGTDPTPANNTDTADVGVYEGIFTVSASRGGGAIGKGAVPIVRVFDVTTGLESTPIQPYENTYRGGVRVAVGDLNGDGFLDIVTAKRSGDGEIRVFDGVTHLPLAGALGSLKPFAKGGAYLALGDVNGDGTPDIIAGSGNGYGAVRVLSGTDGAEVTTLKPFGNGWKGGVTVAAGDVDGDGRSELVMGQGSYGSKVRVQFASGAESALTFTTGAARLRDGVSVAAADLDGDGLAEIVVGRGAEGGRGGASIGIYDVQKGIGAAQIDSIKLSNQLFRFGARVAATDLNFDGIADIIVGAGPGGRSTVQFFDGATGSLSDSLIGFTDYAKVGLFVSAGTVPAIRKVPV